MTPTMQPPAEPQGHPDPMQDNLASSDFQAAQSSAELDPSTAPVEHGEAAAPAPDVPIAAVNVEQPAATEPAVEEPTTTQEPTPVVEPPAPEPSAPVVEPHTDAPQTASILAAEAVDQGPAMVEPAVVQSHAAQDEAETVALITPPSGPSATMPNVPPMQTPHLVMGSDSSAALRLPLVYPVTDDEPSVAKKRWRIVGLSAAALIVVVVGGAMGAYVAWRNSGQLANGLIIQGEPVGGLTQTEARRRLEKRFGRLFVTLETTERPFKVSLSELGGKPAINRMVQNAYWYGRSDNIFRNMLKVIEVRRNEKRLKLPVQWDKAQLRQKMWMIATQYNQRAIDAKLEVADEGVQIIPHQEGRKINVGATLQRLQHRYYVGLPTVESTVERVTPRLRTADLAGTDVKMGEYTTYFDSGEIGRSKNLRVAAASINGTVIMPGQKFSFNQKTGERTWDKGYRMAHIFVRKQGEAQVVDGLAGGTCQVSSTLYNAVRRTNNKTDGGLRILERNHHMLPVNYVPYGLDATVAWPHKDFQFRNTFGHPVYLRTEVRGGRITISVWARVPENVGSMVVPATENPTEAMATAQKAARSTTEQANETQSNAVEAVTSNRRAQNL